MKHILKEYVHLLIGKESQYFYGADYVRLFTDEKVEYKLVLQSSPPVRTYQQQGIFTHIRIPSTLPRTLRNDLFAVIRPPLKRRGPRCPQYVMA